jgi:hypothetical protein
MKIEDRHKFKIWDGGRECFLKTYDIALGVRHGVSWIGIPRHVESDLEIVMCTGLKDKNGIFIYEGDILDIDGILVVVTWIDDGWKLISNDGTYNGDALAPQIRSFVGVDNGNAIWGEIVGNMFDQKVESIA